MTGASVRVEDVWFRYPLQPPALRAVSLTIQAGEFVALVGQNGSGKTTLAKHFNGILRPEQGQVFIDDADVASRDTAEMASVVGYCYQNPDHQIFAATVAEEIEFGPRNLHVERDEIVRRTRRLLETVRLQDEWNAYPFSLSRGQRQKLAVASVLAMEPRILIVDEPTTGLDWQGGEAMMELMRQLNEEGRTIVMITHDMNIVAEYAKRVVVMAGGQIVADGDPYEVFGSDEALRTADLRAPQAFRVARRRPDLFGNHCLTVHDARSALLRLSPPGVGSAAS